MSRQKTQFSRVSLRAIEKLVTKNGAVVSGRGKQRAVKSVKAGPAKAVQSRGA